MSRTVEGLVGRAEELDSLEQALAELARGGGAAIELVGEPGIGKTRLLAELAERADARGWLVLSGSGSELERDLPFSLFVDALDEYVRGLDPGSLDALDESVRVELAHALPSLSELAATQGLALQHERYRAHRAVQALLEHLAGTRPLVLLLDDVHWADPASLELLGALLRRPPAADVLIAISLRPRQLSERFAAALERAHRAGAVTRIELGALTPDEAHALLGEAVSVDEAAALYEESGGNPFYLEQLARSHERVAHASVQEVDTSDIGVPFAVAASLSEELALLSESGRLLLEGAAVAGDPFEPELAAAAAATSVDAALVAIDELLHLDLVRTTDVPRRFRFRHPLVRRAVYEATAGGWRLAAHERCADALAARGATAAARGHHVARSAREGDIEAVAVLREAGEASARLAPASAARWFADALRVLPRGASAEERVELLVARAAALTAAGHYADSHGALLEAVELVPEGNDALRFRTTRACAGVEALLGLHGQAHDRLERAVRGVDASSSPEAVALVIELAMNGLWRTSYDAMREAAERAVEAGRTLGDAPLTAAALGVRGLAASMTGAPELAESDLSEAAALVDSLSDDELARCIEAAAWLAGAERNLDRYVDAEAHAERALAVARMTGQGELYLVLIRLLGGVRRMRGRLAEAGELADGGIESARLLGNTNALSWSLFGRSAVALAEGDVELALATARESVELTRDPAASFHAAGAGVTLAGALLESGDAEGAVDVLLGSAGGEELALVTGSARAGALELLTRSLLDLGRLEDAAQAAARAETWARAAKLPMATGWAERASAAVDLAAGDAVRASERAVAAAKIAGDVGAPIEAGLSRVLAGRALAAAGETERAIAELERAAAELDACGARRYREDAERELRKLGRRIHRRTRPGKAGATGIESLTERELQVARLVVDRMTNPQIAAELYLSQKTVETHLRNIFRKLDVSSRVALARSIERADRTGEPTS